MPAIIEVLQGDARVTLDGEEKELSAGSWVYMEAKLSPAIYARTDVIMLLTVLTGAAKQNFFHAIFAAGCLREALIKSALEVDGVQAVRKWLI